LTRKRKRLALRPEYWAGWSPNGIGQQKPHHYSEIVETVRDNIAHPKYAWDVLTKGVCDGCALGVAGLRDWTQDGIHLCTTRLRFLEVNGADAIDPILLSDVDQLARRSGAELRKLGRLAYPMRRRRGDAGFTRIGWDEALDAMGSTLRRGGGERAALYLTSRGLTNESYYVAGKAARALGIASVDSAARVCHAPSTVALKETIGAAATTCSLTDVIESDLIVIWGANPANNQPVFMKYLFLARQRGARIVVVNPYLEPGLERYWVPSNLESAIFGTTFCDLHVPVRPGGDLAFANAALKRLIERDAVDQSFIDAHTEGWGDVVRSLATQAMDDLLGQAGLTEVQLDAFVDEYAQADAAILLWSMGITQHREAVDSVRSIVNLGLARGNVGRDGAGLMPLRGHSGVQGGAEMGAYATALPGGLEVNEDNARHLEELWGFTVPSAPGWTAPEMLEACERDDLDLLWVSGGNFLDVLPDPDRVAAAMGRVPLRVHQDIVISSQMLVPGDDVILLPVSTRYEQEGGGTETTTERRIVFSPEIPRPRPLGETRSEWRVFAHVAARTHPDLAPAFSWADNVSLRTEIARVVPLYSGIETLAKTGDQVQWGGRHLCADGIFPTANQRGRFSVLEPEPVDLPGGMFTVATRRGKQFNSMVWKQVDPLTGAGRSAVYMDEADAGALGLSEGDPVRLRSEHGHYDGTVKVVRLPHRSLQIHWPEGQGLLGSGPDGREPRSQVPDYNALVTVTPLAGD
jgi:molybdopterin-dependent oxidoreductase alpha subunit